VDENPGGQIHSSAIIQNGDCSGPAKTKSEHLVSLTGSVFSTLTATLAYERFNCVL